MEEGYPRGWTAPVLAETAALARSLSEALDHAAGRDGYRPEGRLAEVLEQATQRADLADQLVAEAAERAELAEALAPLSSDQQRDVARQLALLIAATVRYWSHQGR